MKWGPKCLLHDIFSHIYAVGTREPSFIVKQTGFISMTCVSQSEVAHRQITGLCGERPCKQASKIWTTTQSLTIGRGKALKGKGGTWFTYRYLTLLVYARMLDHPQPASHHSHSFMHLFTLLPDFILLWWLTKTLRITGLFAFCEHGLTIPQV